MFSLKLRKLFWQIKELFLQCYPIYTHFLLLFCNKAFEIIVKKKNLCTTPKVSE